MNIIYFLFAVVLLLTIVAGMFRIFFGPTAADRMMAAQLFGTSGIAILLVLSKGMKNEALLDVALIFALLAIIATITFVQRTWLPASDKEGIDG